MQTRVHRSWKPSFGVLHRPVLLLPSHITIVRGIPVTTPARTLFDLAGRFKYERIEVVAERVIAKSPGTLIAMHDMLEQLACKGRPGITNMRRFLKARPLGYVPCATGLELKFRKLGEEAGVRDLRRQVDLGGHDWLGRVDFLDEMKIVYEVDSILHHTTPGDRLRDEQRDKALKAAGFRDIVRIPEEWIWQQPWKAVQRVAEARTRAFSVTRTEGVAATSRAGAPWGGPARARRRCSS
jgi:very-short-patch-repair endonuclease